MLGMLDALRECLSLQLLQIIVPAYHRHPLVFRVFGGHILGWDLPNIGRGS